MRLHDVSLPHSFAGLALLFRRRLCPQSFSFASSDVQVSSTGLKEGIDKTLPSRVQHIPVMTTDLNVHNQSLGMGDPGDGDDDSTPSSSSNRSVTPYLPHTPPYSPPTLTSSPIIRGGVPGPYHDVRNESDESSFDSGRDKTDKSDFTYLPSRVGHEHRCDKKLLTPRHNVHTLVPAVDTPHHGDMFLDLFENIARGKEEDAMGYRGENGKAIDSGEDGDEALSDEKEDDEDGKGLDAN